MKHSPQLILVALLFTALSSCRLHIDLNAEDDVWFNSQEETEPVVLAEVEAEDGSTTTYSLKGQSTTTRQAPETVYLTISTNYTLPVPFLGVDVGSIDVDRAAVLGVTPWEGVLVSAAEAGLPASNAGIRPGDLLLGMGDVRFRSVGEFSDHVKHELEPGKAYLIDVSREVEGGAREVLTLELTVGSRDREESESTTEAMPVDPTLFNRAGLTAVTVAPERSGEIWGAARPTALVTSVVTGSDAYKEGVRAGDRIVSAAGVPVEAVDEIAELLMDLDDGDEMPLELVGPLGLHAASVTLVRDVLEESDVNVPVLYYHHDRPHRSHTGVLNFLLQFGFNRRTQYWASQSRDVRKTTSLSILPLGMFEFKRTPTKETNRIFWLIRWSSKR